MQAAKHCSLFDLTRFHELSESCRHDVMAGDGGSSARLYNVLCWSLDCVLRLCVSVLNDVMCSMWSL